MEAKELRIGNYFSTGQGDNISKVTPNTIQALWESEERIWINPIPLTEEWLLKLGFEKIYNSDLRAVFDYALDFRFGYNDNFGLNNINSGVTFRGEKIDSIKYVHQLQNFFHSITQKELIIK